MLARQCASVSRRFAASAVSSSTHCLLNIQDGTWRSRGELVDLLQRSIVFDSNHLLALSKPVGLSVFGASRFVPFAGDEKRDELLTLSLRDVLSDISGKQVWNIVLALEREFSGVTLLAKTERAHRELVNYYKNTIASVPDQLGHDAVLASTFLVIVRDVRIADASPPQRVVFERVSLNDELSKQSSQIDKRSAKAKGLNASKPTSMAPLEPNKPVGDDVLLTRIVDSKNVTKSLLKRHGTLHRPFVSHQVLAKNEAVGCSLLAVHMSSTKWHALEAYLVSQRARILGESMYSRRISLVNGQPVYIPLAVAYKPGWTKEATVDREVLKALQLPVADRSHGRTAVKLPTFVHRYQLTVPKLGYAGQSRSANRIYDTIVAQLPAHFVYALEYLGLKFDPSALAKSGATAQLAKTDCT